MFHFRWSLFHSDRSGVLRPRSGASKILDPLIGASTSRVIPVRTHAHTHTICLIFIYKIADDDDSFAPAMEVLSPLGLNDLRMEHRKMHVQTF